MGCGCGRVNSLHSGMFAKDSTYYSPDGVRSRVAGSAQGRGADRPGAQKSEKEHRLVVGEREQLAMKKVAVVTGSASGIGEATVRRLLRSGVDVIGVDISAAPADLAATGMSGQLHWLQADVGHPRTWEQVNDLAESVGKKATLLVTCAMRTGFGDLLTLSESDWDAIFRVTFYGAMFGIRSCLPGMIASGGGSIVTVGSVSGQLAEQGLVAYGAAKAALIQLTRSVAVDFARKGVRANCVCPGTTNTPSFRYHIGKAGNPAVFLRRRENRNPIGRILEADEVAAAVEFLASEAASGITGTVLTVDGGLTSCFEYRSQAEEVVSEVRGRVAATGVLPV